jgi:hypothetical protein
MCHVGCSHAAAATAPVLDHDLLPQVGRHALGNDASQDVYAAAGRQRDNQLDRPRRKRIACARSVM